MNLDRTAGLEDFAWRQGIVISHTCGGILWHIAVIASEAKLSIITSCMGKIDCFAARVVTRDVVPAKADIQYAAAYRFHHCCLWNTGSPAFAFAGDDDQI